MTLPADFAGWLAGAAEDIDLGRAPCDTLLPRMAAAGLTSAGVTEGTVIDGIRAISDVAEESLAAAFMLWGHRCYIEFLRHSPNAALRDRLLPDLLAGRVAGASGLSNAMKFLAGLEPLQITAREEGEALILDGRLHWVTNLRAAGFHVAAAADRAEGGPAMIVSLAHDDAGLVRSPDLDLMAMRSSDTAAVEIRGVRVPKDRIIAPNAAEWLPKVRPCFVGLQCGMSLGLARRSLAEAAAQAGAGRGVLAEPLADLRSDLDRAEARLFAGVEGGEFIANAPALFELRIELARIVNEAVGLELQAAGGRAYLAEPGRAFARRWREAAFIPVITPSLVQLRTALKAARKAA